MPNQGDYGKGSSGRGKTDMKYLPGSPDYRQMMSYRGYKEDMYDRMTPKNPSATGDPNTGIQGAASKKGSSTQSKDKGVADTGKEGNTYKKDYAKMSESQPKEVQNTRKKAKAKEGPIKSIKDLRARAQKADGDWRKSRSGKVVG
jgi:hypothetical protein